MKPCYNTDKLYLLEIMVSRLCIDYDKLGMSNDRINSLRQIIVFCQFQDFPELQICEEEFCKVEDYGKGNEVILRSGKSCLFSARSLAENLDYFTINVRVGRELEKEGCIMLGCTCVQLDCHFVDVLKINSCQNSRTMEDTYPIYNAKCCCIGNITLSVRLSSLGKMILTSVQGGKGSDDYVVKGEGVPTDLGGMGDNGNWSQSNDCANAGGNEINGRLLGGTEQVFQEGYPQYASEPLGPAQYGNELPGPMQYGGVHAGMPYGNMQGMPYGNMQGMPYGNMQGMMQMNQQQISAYHRTLPGQAVDPQNARTSQGKAVDPISFCGHVQIRPSSSTSDETPPSAPLRWPSDMFCSCEYPLPPGFDEPPPPPKKKKKKKKGKPCPLELKGSYCVKPNCPIGLPQLPGFPSGRKSKEMCSQFPLENGSIGMTADQMTFQLQKQQELDNLKQHGPDRPGPNTLTLEDEKNDIYILKIGSKTPNTKPKLILELKTPKLKADEVRTQETDTQYQEADFTLPAPPKEVKGKKGKKGKGKKGKGKGKAKGKKGKKK